MVFEKKALAELLDLMYELGQPFPETITLAPKDRIVHEIQESCEARREWERESKHLYGPPLKKSDFLKTVAIPTGPTPKVPIPFERVDLRRITNAIDPSLKQAKTHAVDEFAYYPWRF